MAISNEQRRFVRQRANDCCEYCRMPEGERLGRFQVDHIISLKHGGTDDNDNLCLACFKCNGYKGSNVAALDPQTGAPTKLYDPRAQNWEQHFYIHTDGTIEGLTPEGRTTVAVLRFNDEDRVETRYLGLLGRTYPCG